MNTINHTTTNFILRYDAVNTIAVNWSKDTRFDVCYRIADGADGSKAILMITNKKTGQVRIEGKRISRDKWAIKKHI